ncbi:dihydroorotase [Erythrobacter sp. HL-111]|uniref:dihydroorotase n=1 Tax=Erythrobacter sp. HL-111 TaxID=1798193 RepID=UPI0006DB984C|nr:dihydroorotase [Erythrobacter sp. HL-111]KPP93352.1 MAG: homodimeric type dihydroorotase PyrC [Erythrobacteraceae bacterium HL-111]SDR72200.1 dihydroorotase [Erythrobacter sp. HL-111]
MTDSLTIRRPDDWHLHFRDGAVMRAVVPYTARQFARAIVMPNLVPPITTAEMAAAYRERILAAVPEGVRFTPLMTCYLTDTTDADDLARGAAEGVFTAAKLYPANATTNSAAGVSDVERIYPVLERMEAEDIVLCIHGEVTDHDIDIFDREAEFIDRHLKAIIRNFPRLRVVFEHVTTADAVAFVTGCGPNVAATITPQHLHLNRNAMLAGGIRPHNYCLPVAKREKHRIALRAAATSGSPKFFLGTDSAPHFRHDKESACGCAGIFGAPHALESYLAVFEEEDALGRFEGFASLHGPAFYGLPVNEETITLERAEVAVPEELALAGAAIVPFHAGQTLGWRIAA